jgi:hypothetical protein
MFDGMSRPRRRPFRHAAMVQRPGRHTLRIPCQVVRERDFRLVADRIDDLSIDGMLVAPADPVLTGEPVIVTFQAPGSDEWFDAEATVARVVHARRPGEVTRGLGLVFDRLPRRHALARLLAAMPPAPPRHRPGRRDVHAVVRALVNRSGMAAMPAHPLMLSAARFAQYARG